MVVLGMLVFIYLIIKDYWLLEVAKSKGTEQIYVSLSRMSLWAFFFGIFTEWKGLEKLIGKKFSFNWQLFIPSTILTIVVLIPNVYWIDWFGVPMPDKFLGNVFFLQETNMILSVLAGAMFLRSLVEK